MRLKPVEILTLGIALIALLPPVLDFWLSLSIWRDGGADLRIEQNRGGLAGVTSCCFAIASEYRVVNVGFEFTLISSVTFSDQLRKSHAKIIGINDQETSIESSGTISGDFDVPFKFDPVSIKPGEWVDFDFAIFIELDAASRTLVANELSNNIQAPSISEDKYAFIETDEKMLFHLMYKLYSAAGDWKIDNEEGQVNFFQIPGCEGFSGEEFSFCSQLEVSLADGTKIESPLVTNWIPILVEASDDELQRIEGTGYQWSIEK